MSDTLTADPSLLAKLRVIREIARCALDGTLDELHVSSQEEAWDLIIAETEGAAE